MFAATAPLEEGANAGVGVDVETVTETGLVLEIADSDTVLSSYTIAVVSDVNGDGLKNSADARAILTVLIGRL